MDLFVKPELKREGDHLWWKPNVTGEWERYACCEWIPVVDDIRTWDEDIWNAKLGDYLIYLDGGKGLSIWQCSLVLEETDGDGKYLGPIRYMRDWFETIEEVQAWILRACEIGGMLFRDENKYKREIIDEEGEIIK